jgi:hypothetical protein
MGTKLDLELELESMLFFGGRTWFDLKPNLIFTTRIGIEIKIFFGRTWPESEFPISFMSKIVIPYPLVRFNNQVVNWTDFKAPELAAHQVKLF